MHMQSFSIESKTLHVTLEIINKYQFISSRIRYKLQKKYYFVKKL